MGSYLVRGGARLSGAVRVSGMTKNAALKQMAAALLAPGVTVLDNVTRVADLDVMIDLLRAVGAEVEWSEPGELRIDTTGPLDPVAPYELVTRMRASINVLGPLLARCGEAHVAMPGGDNIGHRKLDMHFGALEAMGVELDVVHGFIEARCNVLSGARIDLEFPSVGATETVLTVGVVAKGHTVIENAAREPEIVDLCAFLEKMGAQIMGAGTSTIEIEGVEDLRPAGSHTIVGDRIEAGTLLMACGIAGGEVVIEGIGLSQLGTVTRKLTEMGMTIEPAIASEGATGGDGIAARSDGPLSAVDLQTMPFPGFATDFMPPAVALLATAEGTAIVTENIFESRFAFINELTRMGAEVRTEGRHAIVRGVPRLSGAPVRAFDVRAGAALMLAGLQAEGETTIFDTHHVERGYADLPSHLRALGADVERVPA